MTDKCLQYSTSAESDCLLEEGHAGSHEYPPPAPWTLMPECKTCDGPLVVGDVFANGMCRYCGGPSGADDLAKECERLNDESNTGTLARALAFRTAAYTGKPIDEVDPNQLVADFAGSEVTRALDALAKDVEAEDVRREEYVMMGPYAFARYQRRVVALIAKHRPGGE